MAVRRIRIPDIAASAQEVELDGRLYRLVFRWNGRMQTWFMDIENGAGVPLTLPAACHADYTQRPDSATVQAWVNEIYQLLDDEAAYREKARAARAAATPFLVDGRRREIADAYT